VCGCNRTKFKFEFINQTIELVEKNNFCRYRNRILNSFNLNFEYIKELFVNVFSEKNNFCKFKKRITSINS
jgi:hypothetical protein